MYCINCKKSSCLSHLTQFCKFKIHSVENNKEGCLYLALRIATSVYPLAADTLTVMGVITHNYFAWVAVVSMLVLTITGWDRFIPLFSIPREPEVSLKKGA